MVEDPVLLTGWLVLLDAGAYTMPDCGLDSSYSFTWDQGGLHTSVSCSSGCTSMRALTPSPPGLEEAYASDLDASVEELDKDSPPNLPTPHSEVAKINLPCPSKDYTAYSHLIRRIVKVMDLAVDQPVVEEVDKVYKDITKDQPPPLCIAFISSLLKLAKEPWEKPFTSYQIPRRVENLDKRHSSGTEFLSKHPLPNSFVVDATQNRARKQSTSTPNNKESWKLDILGRWIYSLGHAHRHSTTLMYSCKWKAFSTFAPAHGFPVLPTSLDMVLQFLLLFFC